MKLSPFDTTTDSSALICLGSWVFGGQFWQGNKEIDSFNVLSEAPDLGINVIDTAPIYGNGQAERIIGKYLKKNRSKYFVATKCGLIKNQRQVSHNLSANSIHKEINDSLQRLCTDHVDLYQCHWPDPQTPIEETLNALLQLKREGKIRHIGLSNYDKQELTKALEITGDIVSLQSPYSFLNRSIEKKIMPLVQNRQLNLMIYGALAGGILTGKYRESPQFNGPDARNFFYKYYDTDSHRIITDFLKKIETIQKPLNQIAINWVRQNPTVKTVILGCRNLDQLKSNAAALQWELSCEEISLINKNLPFLDNLQPN
ncbi:MAG: aldo/keto reductase [Candidatus Omnitrophica bacterium]|nr:aldo/keto reductase [Candidatus Omnitrophota bacterium]